VVHGGFAAELVYLFLTNFRTTVEVSDICKIGSTLDQDVFNVPARLSDQRLSGLATCIHLGGDCPSPGIYCAESNV
jgi:hypothetical protein